MMIDPHAIGLAEFWTPTRNNRILHSVLAQMVEADRC